MSKIKLDILRIHRQIKWSEPKYKNNIDNLTIFSHSLLG